MDLEDGVHILDSFHLLLHVVVCEFNGVVLCTLTPPFQCAGEVWWTWPGGGGAVAVGSPLMGSLTPGTSLGLGSRGMVMVWWYGAHLSLTHSLMLACLLLNTFD